MLKTLSLILMVTFILLPTTVLCGQDATHQGGRSDREAVGIVILNFPVFAGSDRVRALETMIPQLMRAILFRYDWLDVRLGSELKEAIGDSRISIQSLPNIETLKTEGISFLLGGKITQIRDRIRLDLDLKDLTDGKTLFVKYDVFSEQDLLGAVDEMARNVAERLERKPSVAQREIVFAITKPFINRTGDEKYSFLGNVLPMSLMSQLSQAKIRNLSFKGISQDEAGKGAVKAEATIEGEYFLKDNIIVSLRVTGPSGAAFSLSVQGSATRTFELTDALSSRAQEIINGRITPEGKWKDQPILLTEAGAEQFFSQGKKYLQIKDYDSAILMYRIAIEKEPTHAGAHFGLADIYMMRKNYGKAISEYNDVMKFDGDNAAARYGLGMAYLGSGNFKGGTAEFQKCLSLASKDQELLFKSYKALGDAYLLQADHEQAIDNYLKAMKIDDKNSDIYHSLGQAYVAAGRSDEAIRTFEQGSRLFPEESEFKDDLASVYNRIGGAHFAAKKYKDAIEYYKKTIELNPKDKKLRADAYFYAGLILGFFQEKKDFKTGIEYLQKSVADDPGNQLSHTALGIFYHLAGLDNEAIQSLKRANDIEATYWSCEQMGEAYLKLGKYDLAIQSLNKAISLDQDDPEAYYTLGRVYAETERYDLAITNLKQALKIDPRYEQAYDALEAVYKETKEPEKFISLLEEAVKSDPGYYYAYANLGYGYFTLGKYDQAIENLNKAILLDPKDEWPYRVLGVVYSRKGENDKAIANLNISVRIEPTKMAYGELGRIYRRMKDYPEAIRNLNEALKIDPRYDEAYDALEAVYKETNGYEKFISLLEDVVKSNPDYYMGYLKLGIGYKSLTKYDKAIENLDRAVQIKPTGEAYALLGECYRQKKDHKNALKNIREAIARSPKDLYAFETWVQSELDRGEYKNAIDIASKVIQLCPDCESGYFLTATAYHKMRNDQGGVRVLKTYLEKDPNNVGILSTLGFIYHEYLYDSPEGYTEAYGMYSKAYEYRPKSIQCKENYAEANLTTDQFPEALTLASEILKDQTLPPDEKLGMKLIEATSLLFQGNRGEAFAGLKEFIDFYSSVPEYGRSWTFDGTKNFVKKHPKLRESEKGLIMQLIEILESPKSAGDAKIEKFKSSLGDTLNALGRDT
ncbi:MAG TPA: tetratricopeptide repeat protein [Syntrophorhabdales bacterium]|nr:tetratricopeptide repeat protein [Syntrophorhabdales bacterium]